ncbi:MAG TPA: thioredoxin domain-containing protein, partial [Anaerolineales bacterium]|nr:thioredoxin domain-containing protein [Anaerolineales bacterium]
MSNKLISLIFILTAFATACGTSPAAPTTVVSATPNIIIPTPPSCTEIITDPTPGPDTPSVFPPESKADRVRGAENPSVTIVDYSDYQDFRSGLFEVELNQLLKEHPNDVRVVSRVFPLIAVNDKAALAAQAAEAAAEQNKFWEIHNLLFAQQENWVDLSVQDFEQWLTARAAALEMNVDQFKSDMKREDIVAKIQKAWEDGKAMGLPGTPLVLINGQIYGGPRDYSSLNDILQLMLLG